MRFVFGYAGIPSEIYDSIYKSRLSITGQNADFEGTPGGPFGTPLNKSHAIKLLHKLKDRATKETRQESENTAYAVVYVKNPYYSPTEFEQLFFPNTFIYPVEWEPDWSTTTSIQQSKNELAKKLREATSTLKPILHALKKEVTEKSNRTPLLLPTKNFKSDTFLNYLKELQCQLVTEGDPGEKIRQINTSFERNHPMQRTDNKQRPCFIDDAQIEFHSPGSARHGILRATPEHNAECILGGIRRLGAPYHPAFHYDCIKGKGNLKGIFHNCHGEEPKAMEGKPHLNIAPNNFVRI